tara:strand:+ start:29691 stop:30422 length:732 start_codon:yes stop_codon:yes gene_type:complete
METPNKILVTICNYNHNQYLKESIESIQNQSYDNLDICVVDDGSDNLEEFKDILEGFSDTRIRYHINNENKGKWWCLNEAIRTTDATICTSHDADDVSLKQRIQAQYLALVESKAVNNLCGFYHCFEESHVKKYKDLTLDVNDGLKLIGCPEVTKTVTRGFQLPGINHFYTGNFETAGTSAMFYQTIWIHGIRFHPPNLGLRTLLSEDSDFNYRVTALTSRTSILAEKLYCYRRNTSTNQEEL